MSKSYFNKIAKQVADTFDFGDIVKGRVDLGYIENNRHKWNALCEVGRCAILLFDFFSEKFVYISSFGFESFGLTSDEFIKNGHNFIAEKVHKEDMEYALNVRKQIYSFLNLLNREEKKDYKAIHRMRILNINGTYIRVTEHEQVAALDTNGNIWLMLSIVDIDADDSKEDFKSYLYNCRTGDVTHFSVSNILDEPLTLREIEVLRMMKNGDLSKEISDKLSISINTVHTHRQNILRKLNVENSIEAINYAKKIGLI